MYSDAGSAGRSDRIRRPVLLAFARLIAGPDAVAKPQEGNVQPGLSLDAIRPQSPEDTRRRTRIGRQALLALTA